MSLCWSVVRSQRRGRQRRWRFSFFLSSASCFSSGRFDHRRHLFSRHYFRCFSTRDLFYFISSYRHRCYYVFAQRMRDRDTAMMGYTERDSRHIPSVSPSLNRRYVQAGPNLSFIFFNLVKSNTDMEGTESNVSHFPLNGSPSFVFE